jgi:hypothetical protein
LYYFINLKRNSKSIEVGRISTKKALDTTLRKFIKKTFSKPDADKIIDCIIAKVNATPTLEGQALEDAINDCIDSVGLSTTDAITKAKRLPRGHIHVGG